MLQLPETCYAHPLSSPWPNHAGVRAGVVKDTFYGDVLCGECLQVDKWE